MNYRISEDKLKIILDNYQNSIETIVDKAYQKGFERGVERSYYNRIGKWEQEYKEHGNDVISFIETIYKCSQCGEQAPRITNWYMLNLSNYCPNCGAYMKEYKDEK